MRLPNIEHIISAYRPSGAISITAESGYVFYDKNDFADLTDEDGNPREPLLEELYYIRYRVFGISVTAEEIESRIVVVAEADVPADQIFGVGQEAETI